MEAPLIEGKKTHLENLATVKPHHRISDPNPAESDSSDVESWQVSWDSPDPPSPQSPAGSLNTEEPTGKTPEPMPADQCQFCSSMEFVTNRAGKYRHAYFHEECSSCSSADVPLCEFCQHLRLQHLLLCLPHNIPYSFFYIRLHSPIDISTRKGCGFCHFLAEAIPLPLPEPARTADLSSAQLDLQFNKEEHSRSTHTHWHLHVSVNRDGEEFNNFIEIHQKFLRDICVECIPPQYGALDDFEEFIPWNSVRKWLSDCDSNHGECSVNRKPSLPPDFRVIDVESRRVVQIPDCKFVALSYVWGSRPASPSYVEEATSVNIEALNSTGLGELPKTIEDAISVCKHLAKQYLWVDRYCIVEDDDENKHSQINAMADIFTASDLTIIACSGVNVDSALPGVEEKRQGTLSRINFNGVELTHAPPNFRPTVSKSIWNSRGWTYQEAILARRKLFLTPTSASLECIRERKGEVNVSDMRFGFDTSLHSREDNEQNTLVQDYCRHLQNYTHRRLSYDEDIYDAFDGIAHALYRDKYSFHFGIPESHFDQGLLWICNEFSCSSCEGCKHDDERNSKPGQTHIENRPDCNSCNSNGRYLRSCKQTTPSWSWASVRCPVAFDGPDNFTNTLVKWIVYKHENSEIHPRTIKPLDESGEWLFWENRRQADGKRDGCCPQLYFALAVKERCFEANIQCSIPKEDSFPKLRKRFTKRWPKYADVYAELPDISPREGPRSDGLLFTRAQSAFFCIDSHWIKDSEGRAIGHVAPDLRLHKAQTSATSQKLCMEFIALSISTYYKLEGEICHNKPSVPDWTYWYLPMEEYRDMTYLDCNGLPLLPVPVVNVMVICWEGEFAGRVTVGLIVLKEWAKAERTFKDIWLK